MVQRIELDWIQAMSSLLDKKIIWIEFKPVVKPGDNYASLLTRATLTYRNKNAEDRGCKEEGTLTVVVKEHLNHKDPGVQSSLDRYFKSEIMMYREVFTVFKNLMKDGYEADKLWPDCYYVSPSDTLIMEDLKEGGFELPRQLSLLPEDHAVLILQAMGRLHALSAAAVHRGQLNPSTDSRFSLFFTEELLGDNFVLTGMQSVADVIKDSWGSEWEPIYHKFIKIREDIMEQLRRLEKEPGGIKVINHGDIWSRNVMFSYDGDKPKNLRFLDYQNPNYNSFAFDICHFLYGCISPDLRLQLRSNLQDIYLESFKKMLTSLEEDLKLLPTKEDITQELNRLELLGLVVACTVLPLNCYQGDVELSMDDYMNIDPNRNTENARKSIYNNPVFTNLLKDNLIYFESINIIK